MPRRLMLDDWLSAREARELLFYFIRWGQHERHELRQLPDDLVENTLKSEGYPWTQTISELQANPHRAIAYFENLATGGNFELFSSPENMDIVSGTITVEFIVDGVSLPQSSFEDGSLMRMDYTAQFSAACRARDAAIKASDVDDLFTMLTKGFASIDSFLALRAHVYNHGKADEDKLIDGGSRRYVPTEIKLKKWLPIMSRGSLNFDSSSAGAKFLRLKKIRDDSAIHPKITFSKIRLEDIALNINDFREGIGSTMFVIHQLFGLEVPSDIIRATQYPTVRVVPA